eukprot:g9434.t2
MVLGAAGYMFLQQLEPSVRRRSELLEVKKPVRRSAGSAGSGVGAEEKMEKESRVKVSIWKGSPPDFERRLDVGSPTSHLHRSFAAIPVQENAERVERRPKEVKKPSVVPVQAPKFQAIGWDAEVAELLQNIVLTSSVRAHVDSITQSPGLAQDTVRQKVKDLLLPVLPSAKIDGYVIANPLSGTAFGVAVPDVEIVVLSTQATGAEASKYQKSLIRTCTDRLVTGGFKFRRSAFRGHEPKVTLISPPQSGQAGIPFNLAAREKNSSCASQLMLLVRRWAKERWKGRSNRRGGGQDDVDRGISHAAKGHLSPYCWMLLAIYYLQEVGALKPGLGFLKASTDFSGSSGELLKGFMHFYAKFSWSEAISVRCGRRSSALLPCFVENVGRPAIEDPFEAGSDLASGMHTGSLQRLMEEFQRASELCSGGASLAELLEPWVPPEEETPWLSGFPCCLAETTRAAIKCSGAELKNVLITNPDPWFSEMMQPPTTDKNYCPEDCPVDLLCYDPPQKKPSFAKLRQVNLFAPRTPWFRNFPCCLAESADFRHVLISNPDTWFLEMMQPPTADMNYCPEMEIVLGELDHWEQLVRESASFLEHVESQDDYIYVLGPEDKMVDAEGRTYPFVPGLDMLRITFPEGDPKQGLFYQYMMRKVAQKGCGMSTSSHPGPPGSATSPAAWRKVPMRRSSADLKHVLISNPDTWFLEMMQPPAADMNYCPESAATRPQRSWQISADRKWIALGQEDYVYVLGPEDQLVDSKGEAYPFVPGQDLLRITFPEGDPKQGIFYQYMMRRVAQKGANGEVVKTAAYQDLLERVQRPAVDGCCYNLFLCNISDDP